MNPWMYPMVGPTSIIDQAIKALIEKKVEDALRIERRDIEATKDRVKVLEKLLDEERTAHQKIKGAAYCYDQIKKRIKVGSKFKNERGTVYEVTQVFAETVCMKRKKKAPESFAIRNVLLSWTQVE